MTLIAHIHDLLLDHCTRADDDVGSRTQRQRYIDRVERVLTTSHLAPRTLQEVWEIGWDKPFFANNSAARVVKAVDVARQSGIFDDPIVVASPEFLRDGQSGPLVQVAIEQGHLIGACKVPYRLERVQAYAQAAQRITDAVNRFYDTWKAGELQADALQAGAVAIAEDIGIGGGPIGKVPGFGFTTACHLLADLGLPVFKPDIWVCRIVSSLPGVQAEIRRTWRLSDEPVPFGFLESKLNGPRAPDAYRRIVQPVMNALVAETQGLHIGKLDLTAAFLRVRFVDWTLVHFAISADVDVLGLRHRPMDLLCRASDLPTPAHIHALALWMQDGKVAQEADSALAKARSKVHRADTHDKKERAERKLAGLPKNDALRAQAQASWAAYVDSATAARWQLAAKYPEGFARKERSSKWKYIHAALTARMGVEAA